MNQPSIYLSDNKVSVNEKLKLYLDMSTKFISKNKDYKAVYKIFQIEGGYYSLVFNLVKVDKSLEESTQNFYQLTVDVHNGVIADLLTCEL